jgi:hypothetical protein
MQLVLLGHQFVYGLLVELVRYAAIHGANCGTLGFLMKALTFGALVGNDIIGVVAYRCVLGRRVHGTAVKQGEATLHGSAVGDGPFHTALIDGIVGTFRFAGAAVDAFFSDLDSHKEFRFKGVVLV